MDKKRSILNVSVALSFKLVLVIVNILVRRFIIQCIGNEINGLNSLYLSLLEFLAVAELGVGSAITFCMYKPIVSGDYKKVSALYGLFTKLYLIIGCIILVCGMALMPALPYLAKNYQTADVNLYLTFGLMLLSVVITYLFSSKTSLINAYKNNFITTTISSSGMLLQCVMQIGALIIFKSFVAFLICRIIAALLQWVVTEIIARKYHNDILRDRQPIDKETKKEVTKNIKAMFMHKIGGVLVNTADSLIISAFIGIVILGKFSNYTSIATAMMGVLVLCFSPLTSIIGHTFVENSVNSSQRYFSFFYTLNYILGLVFFLGYYAVADNLIAILFDNGLELSKSVVFVITVNYFIQFMRQATTLFRDATGTFYYDRWKPLFEGMLNVALSIGFVVLFNKLWGEDFAVVGVIVATILTNLTICHVIEPFVLYKYAFKTSVKKYYVKNYICIALFIGALTGLHFSLISNENEWIELLANGAISLAFSLLLSVAVIFGNRDFRHYSKSYIDKVRRRLHVRTDAHQAHVSAENVTDEDTRSKSDDDFSE